MYGVISAFTPGPTVVGVIVVVIRVSMAFLFEVPGILFLMSFAKLCAVSASLCVVLVYLVSRELDRSVKLEVLYRLSCGHIALIATTWFASLWSYSLCNDKYLCFVLHSRAVTCSSCMSCDIGD